MVVLHPSFEYGCEVWNTNKFQANAVSTQLHPCEYTLGCSTITCDEPVHADLGSRS